MSACALLAACDSDDDPTGVQASPPPVFHPSPGLLNVPLGDTLRFRAVDLDDAPLLAVYYLDEEAVAIDTDFEYRVSTVDSVVIRAEVVVDQEIHEATWIVGGVTFRSFPSQQNLWMLLGQSLEFEVRAATIDSFAAEFFLDGQPVSTETTFEFQPTVGGTYQIEALTRVDDVEHHSEWVLEVPSLVVNPPVGDVPVLPYETVELSMGRSDGLPMVAVLHVDGIYSGIGDSYEYEAVKGRSLSVEALVATSAGAFSLGWEIFDASPVPAVTNFEVFTPDHLVEIVLAWSTEEPNEFQEAPHSYRVAYSREPFTLEQRDEVDQIVFPHSSENTVQGGALTDLLSETDYYLQVFARDESGVLGWGSPRLYARTAIAPVRIRVHGSAEYLPYDGAPFGAEGVALRIGVDSVVSSAEGAFDFPQAYIDGAQVLELSQGQFAPAFYSMQIGPLPRHDQQYDLLLLPIQSFDMRMSSGETEEVPLLDYVRQMTRNVSGPATEFFGWESYPVTAYVHDYVYEDGSEGPVDYAAALEYAVEAWNLAAGEELLRIQRVGEPPDDTSPLTGFYFAPDLTPSTSADLGKTDIVRPAGARLYEVAPEWVVIHLRSSFIDDWIARYVITHEVGHVLGLDHSVTLDDIMFSVVQNDRSVDPTPSPTEAYVARILRAAPVGSDTSWYQLEAP